MMAWVDVRWHDDTALSFTTHRTTSTNQWHSGVWIPCSYCPSLENFRYFCSWKQYWSSVIGTAIISRLSLATAVHTSFMWCDWHRHRLSTCRRSVIVIHINTHRLIGCDIRSAHCPWIWLIYWTCKTDLDISPATSPKFYTGPKRAKFGLDFPPY